LLPWFNLLNYENEQVWTICVPKDLASFRGKFAGYGQNPCPNNDESVMMSRKLVCRLTYPKLEGVTCVKWKSCNICKNLSLDEVRRSSTVS
jgi:hypothetical protein